MRALVLLVAWVFVVAARSPASPMPSPPPAQVQQFARQHSGAAAGNVTIKAATHKGSVVKLGNLTTYVSRPAEGSAKPKAAVLLITDIFGFETDAIRAWADRLAAKGYVVAVPDYFKGNPRRKSDPMDTFAAWGAQFPRAQVQAETDAVLAALRSQYGVSKVGVQGFCWGGLHAVLLTQGAKPRAAASVVYHGSLLVPADIEAINAPILFENSDPALDRQINGTFFKQIEGILAQKRARGLDASITAYQGMPHGFSLRGGASAESAAVAAAATKTFDRGAAFLAKYLK